MGRIAKRIGPGDYFRLWLDTANGQKIILLRPEISMRSAQIDFMIFENPTLMGVIWKDIDDTQLATTQNRMRAIPAAHNKR